MSQLAQLSALIGFLLPILIAVVQKSHWSRAVKTVVGAIVCIIVATITAIVHGDVTTWHEWATALIFIFGAALVTYRNVWVPLGAAPWIEANVLGGKSAGTSPRTAVPPGR